jgi:biopolymer transport protein ExbB
MNLTDKFLAFALLGAEWVMWLLVGLSVISVGIMIERLIFFIQRSINFDLLQHEVKKALKTKDPGNVAALSGSGSIEAGVAVAGLREAHRGPGAAAEAMVGAKARIKQQFERNLTFLGTLGNNAPFIGLFGTVLGIIKAFHDLSKNANQGAEAVMAGISEALVATAIGLLVAIPAVLAFNFAQRRVRTSVSNSDAIAHVILTELRGEDDRTASSKEAA